MAEVIVYNVVDDPGKSAAILSIASAAIQQTLQIFDPLLDAIVRRLSSGWGVAVQKQSVAAAAAALLATGTTFLLKINLFEGGESAWFGSILVGVALSAGTEGFNSITKYVSYVKDAQKPVDVTVSVTPDQVSVAPGATIKFRARVTGLANTAVKWEDVVVTPGSSIDDAGSYTAPGKPGQYQIRAISDGAPTIVGSARIVVVDAPA